jgi:hypothetical protein
VLNNGLLHLFFLPYIQIFFYQMSPNLQHQQLVQEVWQSATNSIPSRRHHALLHKPFSGMWGLITQSRRRRQSITQCGVKSTKLRALSRDVGWEASVRLQFNSQFGAGLGHFRRCLEQMVGARWGNGDGGCETSACRWVIPPQLGADRERERETAAQSKNWSALWPGISLLSAVAHSRPD